MYRLADKALAKLKKRIKRETKHIEVQSFSDLTPASVNKQTRGMVDRLLEDNNTAYRMIAVEAKKYAGAQLDKAGYSRIGKFDELNTMESTLKGYNEVTGYLYYHEAERKRLRIAEEINTAKHFSNRLLLIAALGRFSRLWYLQTQEYMISIIDDITLESYKEAGVEYARWVAKIDDRTCDICKARHNKVYPVDKFPEKPHYNCRCERVPLHKGYLPKKEELGGDT